MTSGEASSILEIKMILRSLKRTQKVGEVEKCLQHRIALLGGMDTAISLKGQGEKLGQHSATHLIFIMAGTRGVPKFPSSRLSEILFSSQGNK